MTGEVRIIKSRREHLFKTLLGGQKSIISEQNWRLSGAGMSRRTQKRLTLIGQMVICCLGVILSEQRGEEIFVTTLVVYVFTNTQ